MLFTLQVSPAGILAPLEDRTRNPCLFETYLIDNKERENKCMKQYIRDTQGGGKRRFNNKVLFVGQRQRERQTEWRKAWVKQKTSVDGVITVWFPRWGICIH